MKTTPKKRKAARREPGSLSAMISTRRGTTLRYMGLYNRA